MPSPPDKFHSDTLAAVAVDDDYWRRSEAAVETEIDGDIGLYDSRSETVMMLNSTASDIWRLCDGDLSAGELAATLAAAYGVGVEEIRSQVADALTNLAERGLLLRVDR